MRSVVAERLRTEDRERIAAMTSGERVRLALALGDQAVADYARNHHLSLEEARRKLREISEDSRRSRKADRAGAR
jgi:hypothetical protein